MIAERFPGLTELSEEEKLTLMAELLDDFTIEVDVENPAVAAAIEERWREYQEHPERVRPWKEVKARIQSSRR